MRLEVAFSDRVGIASEILSEFARRRLDVVAVEVEPPHIYIDVPALTRDAFPTLREAVARVDSVTAIRPVDLLPGVRRRMHLDALLDALVDPVLAVDGDGLVVVANAAATLAFAAEGEATLTGADLSTLFDDPAVAQKLHEEGFRQAPLEATVQGHTLSP